MAQSQGLVLSYLRSVREQCFLFFSALISHALRHIVRMPQQETELESFVFWRLDLGFVESGDESLLADAGYPVVSPFASRLLGGGHKCGHKCGNHQIRLTL